LCGNGLLAAGCVCPAKIRAEKCLFGGRYPPGGRASLWADTGERLRDDGWWWRTSAIRNSTPDQQSLPTADVALEIARIGEAQASTAVASADRSRARINGRSSDAAYHEKRDIPPQFGGHTFWIAAEATADLSWARNFFGRSAPMISRQHALEQAAKAG